MAYTVTRTGQFNVGDGSRVTYGPWVVVPGVYPSGYLVSITNLVTSGDGHVSGASPGVQFGTVTVRFIRTPGGVGSAALFGTVTVKAVITGTVTGLGSAQAFGTPTVKTTTVKGAGGVSSAQAFGTVTIKASIKVTLVGLGSAQAFGAILTLTAGKTPVFGLGSAQAFGVPTTSSTTPLPATVPVNGIPSAQNFGAALAKAGSVARTVTGIGSAQVFGAITVTGAITRTVSGLGSAQSFGSVKTAFTRQVGGVSSAQNFGVPRTRITVTVGPVASAQVFGTPLFKTDQHISPLGLGSAQAFGLVEAYIAWLHDAVCLDDALIAAGEIDFDLALAECISPELETPPVCGGPICGDGHVCGGREMMNEAECLSFGDAILGQFLVGTRVLDEGATLHVPDAISFDLQPAGVR